jgi:hypothetical protein
MRKLTAKPSSRLLGAGIVLAVGLWAVVGYFLWPSGNRTLTGNAFRLSYPSSWQVTPAAEVARLPNHPLAVLKGADGSITITSDVPQARLDGSLLIKQVKADFSERLEDFHLLSAAMEQTDAGPIFVYSYTPPDTTAVHTVALVPASRRSFLLSSVAAPGATEASRQIAGIIHSFEPS